MQQSILLLILSLVVISCNQSNSGDTNTPLIEGTWKLISGTLVEKDDTTVTDYTVNRSMIKIINATHFAFFSY